jgi:hypothetical protein
MMMAANKKQAHSDNQQQAMHWHFPERQRGECTQVSPSLATWDGAVVATCDLAAEFKI